MFEKMNKKDLEWIHKYIHKCAVKGCYNDIAFWSEELSCYICEYHKDYMEDKINEKMGIV